MRSTPGFLSRAFFFDFCEGELACSRNKLPRPPPRAPLAARADSPRGGPKTWLDSVVFAMIRLTGKGGSEQSTGHMEEFETDGPRRIAHCAPRPSQGVPCARRPRATTKYVPNWLARRQGKTRHLALPSSGSLLWFAETVGQVCQTEQLPLSSQDTGSTGSNRMGVEVCSRQGERGGRAAGKRQAGRAAILD